MLDRLDKTVVAEAARRVRRRLLDRLGPAGHWQGRLASSALSTAVAAWALTCADANAHRALIRRGLEWLAGHQNSDGGWGDTDRSASNIATTLAAWSAFQAAPAGPFAAVVAAAERWLTAAAGSLAPGALASALARRYGADRSFSAPVLAMAALAGGLGQGREVWRHVAALPFELAALPHRWLRALRLPVVSYALPALIAIGHLRDRFAPPCNLITRLLRRAARSRTLRVLADCQPAGGGFLEAAPLTGFVVMSLSALGLSGHVVVRKGVEFLLRGVRADGSWPIDTNLATWVTTLSVSALAAGPGGLSAGVDDSARRGLVDWLLDQQFRRVHPYTRADPGGWAWTDLPGGVPDADDTAGALLALRALAPAGPRVRRSAAEGVRWLLGIQNRDGGVPTFCRGWGRLPFDRSAADLTAHALQAFACWMDALPRGLADRTRRAGRRALAYLRRRQRPDGSWVPLWFGCESAAGQVNPTFGTARVVSALAALRRSRWPVDGEMLARGLEWLLSAQGPAGGWGGAPGMDPSIEETALATDALARLLGSLRDKPVPAGDLHPGLPRRMESAIARAVGWLIDRTDAGRDTPAAPIGLYFAKLWYYEELYPLIFLLSALHRVEALGRFD